MASLPNGHDPVRLWTETQQAVRNVEGAAFLTYQRVLRRVIVRDRELNGYDFRVPHRKCYIIPGARLAEFVERDELGMESDESFPPRAILLAVPEDDLEHGRTETLAQIWRLLFHARVHVVFDQLRESDRLSLADVRNRVERVGRLEFDEIHDVLRRENFLFAESDLIDAYVEFAAVYLELRKFAPQLLAVYFPSIRQPDRIDKVLAADVDFETLFSATRIEGATLAPTAPQGGDETAAGLADELIVTTRSPDQRRYKTSLARAERALARGNLVAAAISFLRSAEFAPDESVVDRALARARTAIDRLCRRLQAALDFDKDAAEQWRGAMLGLLARSTLGFWNADKRLLYDLQKVCVDHERETFTVDPLKWVFTLGRQPIKRRLPNQREVLMSKHLRSATRRLVSAGLSGNQRERLSHLLHDAAEAAERQLRTRLQPLVQQALEEVGLLPKNRPECVAAKKVVEELLDSVVHYGYVTMATLRDVISRNNLKVPDITSPLEIVTGNRLLRADRRMDALLDGVYRRGEIYLRGLQMLSSLAFGWGVGRTLTKYVAIPFGGAYVIFEAIRHVVGYVIEEVEEAQDHAEWVTWLSVLSLGFFLLGVINVPAFRAAAVRVAFALFRILRTIVYDVPRRVFQSDSIRAIFRSRPVVVFRRFLLRPLLITALLCLFPPAVGLYGRPSLAISIVIFLAVNLVLSSRIGRDVEEVTAEWLGRTWNRIRIRIIIAFYELVVESFKRVLEGFERILYAVDEFLRFRSGESFLVLCVKAVLALGWSAVAFVVRIYVTLLIEPQVNPIKHFPVVTVSHKLILPFSIKITRIASAPLEPVLGRFLANTIVGSTVFLLPGVFGFLVWELKENWRLYEANRITKLKPVRIGAHGETMARLLRPGLHSGTLPKLYAKLRRAERHNAPQRKRNKLHEKLHHLEVDVRHFVQRELIGLLAETPAWNDTEITVEHIGLHSKSILIELHCPSCSGDPLAVVFQEQSGWLLADVTSAGWLSQLDAGRRDVFAAALAGFYKLSGVDLVREQIAAYFAPANPPYDVAEDRLLVWPDGKYAVSVSYKLRQRPRLGHKSLPLAMKFVLPTRDTDELVFAETAIAWNDWVEFWDNIAGGPFPVTVSSLLPPIGELDGTG